jgi:hypothetical protein
MRRKSRVHVSGTIKVWPPPELTRLRTSLYDWALGDVKKAHAGGASVGAFLLGAHFIDVLASLYSDRNDGAARWFAFVKTYLPQYDGAAETLYRGYRGALSHHYSADGIRFVDKESNRGRHWATEAGDRALHLETFIGELEAAFEGFYEDLCADDGLRDRVLEKVKERPLLGIVTGPRAALDCCDLYDARGRGVVRFAAGAGSERSNVRGRPPVSLLAVSEAATTAPAEHEEET